MPENNWKYGVESVNPITGETWPPCQLHVGLADAFAEREELKKIFRRSTNHVIVEVHRDGWTKHRPDLDD